jgi:hypothetical protein
MSSTSGKIFFEGVGKWEVGSGERGEGSGERGETIDNWVLKVGLSSLTESCSVHYRNNS